MLNSKLSLIFLLMALLSPVVSRAASLDQEVNSFGKAQSLSQETSNFKAFFDDTTQTYSEGQNIDIKGSLTIENKLTFTKTQLKKLKLDLTKLYLKYQYNDVNKEPFKSKYDKEINKIFQKNLKVKNATTDNIGIFFYPEIGQILREIENKYPKKVKITQSAKKSENGIIISKLNPEIVSVSKLDKYLSTALTFVIPNDKDAKYVCNSKTSIDARGVAVFESGELCDGNFGKSGVYSNQYFFSNMKSSYSGSYETRGGKTYFENEGIDHQIILFYVKDSAGKKSNSLEFKVTK